MNLHLNEDEVYLVQNALTEAANQLLERAISDKDNHNYASVCGIASLRLMRIVQTMKEQQEGE